MAVLRRGACQYATYLYLKSLLLFHHQSIRDPVVLLCESYKKLGTGLTRRNPFLPAAFADDIETRHSSQRYSFRLFNGLMNWKASKQRTVTINSTEAELLAVSSAGKELLWWNRFFESIELALPYTTQIQCDNTQTI